MHVEKLDHVSKHVAKILIHFIVLSMQQIENSLSFSLALYLHRRKIKPELNFDTFIFGYKVPQPSKLTLNTDKKMAGLLTVMIDSLDFISYIAEILILIAHCTKKY